MKSLSKKIISLSFLAFISQGLFAKGSNALALGSVLPERVFRANIATQFRKIDSSFNSEGKRESLGLTTNIIGLATALEYGLTSKTSLQVMVPFVVSNHMTYEPSELTQSKIFKDIVEKSPIKDTAQVAQLVLPKFNEAEYGITGIGDMEVGLLHNWFTNDTLIFSTGLGVRIPTGNSYAASLLRPFGEGFYVGAIRNNLDFPFFDKNVWLSFQHQGEFSLSKSVVGEENPADILTLDDDKKKYSFKPGLSQKAKIQTSFAFEGITHHLKFLSANVSYNFDTQAKTYVNNEVSKERSYLHAINGNIALSGLPYRIPLSLDVDYMAPFAGTNVTKVSETLTFNLRAYLKI